MTATRRGQTSTTDWETLTGFDALGREIAKPVLIDSGFAFHCTCGLTQADSRSRRTAQRRAAEHRAGCPGGNVPLPGNALPPRFLGVV